MLKTNTKLYRERIKAYILGCIDSEDVELSDSEKIPHLIERFKAEYEHPYIIKRYPNRQQRLAEWLMGLPLNFDFYNYKILEVAQELHGCELTDKQEDTILNNWWNHLAYHILKLAE